MCVRGRREYRAPGQAVDSVLTGLLVGMGLLVIGWLCGPAHHRGGAAHPESGRARMRGTSARAEDDPPSERDSPTPREGLTTGGGGSGTLPPDNNR